MEGLGTGISDDCRRRVFRTSGSIVAIAITPACIIGNKSCAAGAGVTGWPDPGVASAYDTSQHEHARSIAAHPSACDGAQQHVFETCPLIVHAYSAAARPGPDTNATRAAVAANAMRVPEPIIRLRMQL
jgi:hypothetical protein